jgi:hypothetical protein
MDRKNGWHKKETVGFLVLMGAEGELYGTGKARADSSGC